MERRLARNVVLYKLLVPLVGLHAEEDAAEQESENQENHDRLLLPELAGAHGHDHGETGEQEHAGVERADDLIQAAGGDRKHVRIPTAVHRVDGEHERENQEDHDHLLLPELAGGIFLGVKAYEWNEKF